VGARLVTVAREISSLNANIIRSRLEAEGIQCFVSGEAVSSVVGLPGYVGVHIDVQVLDFDAARAESILQEFEEAARNEEDDLASRPSIASQLLRFLIIGWLAVFADSVVLSVTQRPWAGVLAGVFAFAGLTLLARKRSSKDKS
jgi:hypothetical protein